MSVKKYSPDATLITPLSETRFRITDVQDHRIVIEFVDSWDSNHPRRTAVRNARRADYDASGAFDLRRCHRRRDAVRGRRQSASPL